MVGEAPKIKYVAIYRKSLLIPALRSRAVPVPMLSASHQWSAARGVRGLGRQWAQLSLLRAHDANSKPLDFERVMFSPMC